MTTERQAADARTGFDFLVFAEGAALFQEAINQSGFAVVDVGNNGNVSSLHVFSFLKTCRVMGLTAHACLCAHCGASFDGAVA